MKKNMVNHEVDLLDNLQVVKCLTLRPKGDSVAVNDAITGKHLFDAPDLDSFEAAVMRPVNVQLGNLWLRLPAEGNVFKIKPPVLYEQASQLSARRRLGRKKRQLLEQISFIYSGKKEQPKLSPVAHRSKTENETRQKKGSVKKIVIGLATVLTVAAGVGVP